MKKILFTALVVCVFLACSPRNDGHNARNSLDWQGMYEGTTPGANSAIHLFITLNEDQTYIISYEYTEKSEESFVEDGVFTWSADGNTVTLDIKDFPPHYHVAENKLVQLDMSGKKITGKHAGSYILYKR